MKYYWFVEYASGEEFFVADNDKATAVVRARKIASDILSCNGIEEPMRLRCCGEVEEEEVEHMAFDVY